MLRVFKKLLSARNQSSCMCISFLVGYDNLLIIFHIWNHKKVAFFTVLLLSQVLRIDLYELVSIKHSSVSRKKRLFSDWLLKQSKQIYFDCLCSWNNLLSPMKEPKVESHNQKFPWQCENNKIFRLFCVLENSRIVSNLILKSLKCPCKSSRMSFFDPLDHLQTLLSHRRHPMLF